MIRVVLTLCLLMLSWVALASTQDEDEANTQYEAMSFFEPTMSQKDLVDLTYQLTCLSVNPGRPERCGGYGHDHHPEVIARALYIAKLGGKVYEYGGKEKFAKLIALLQDDAEAELERIQHSSLPPVR